MPEAVIVDAVRTPVGARSRLARPVAPGRDAPTWSMRCSRQLEVDPASIEDLYCGCGLPQGLQAFNIARIIVLLSERMPMGVNGATISRYCASSLESIRQAANAVVAGQGDAYVAAGVEWVSRQRAPGGRRRGRPERASAGPQRRPDAYIAMGVTAENVAEKYEVSRADRTRAALGRSSPSARRRTASSTGRSSPSSSPTAARWHGTTARARARRSRSCRSWSPPSRRAEGHRRQFLPLNDGAAAVLDVDTRRRSWLKPRARWITAATAALEPEIMRPIGPSRRSSIVRA